MSASNSRRAALRSDVEQSTAIRSDRQARTQTRRHTLLETPATGVCCASWATPSPASACSLSFAGHVDRHRPTRHSYWGTRTCVLRLQSTHDSTTSLCTLVHVLCKFTSITRQYKYSTCTEYITTVLSFCIELVLSDVRTLLHFIKLYTSTRINLRTRGKVLELIL